MTQASTVRVTMLNSMASRDLPEAMDRHVAWGIELLDLKDALFGKRVMDLSDAEAARVADMARQRGLEVYCLSTHLFGGDVEAAGRAGFESDHLGGVDRAVQIARILKPRLIRLLAAAGSSRAAYGTCAEYLQAESPWLIDMYGEAVERIAAAGFRATIENEVGRCILRTPRDVADLFAALGRPGEVCFTWDVQNLWQTGTFPTLEACERLADLTGYLHLKGGRHEEGDPERRLTWRSSLAEASWPVVEVTRRVLAAGRCPVVCLNPSHGRLRQEGAGGDFAKQDLDFLHREIPEIA